MPSQHHTIVMVATSYPRFPGDNVGSFMEPIAHGVAARGHEVHVVAPWHPAVARGTREGNVHFHFFRYAPTESLNVFGYAGALRADVSLRPTAYAVAPQVEEVCLDGGYTGYVLDLIAPECIGVAVDTAVGSSGRVEGNSCCQTVNFLGTGTRTV